MAHIADLGKRIELVPMDPHFHGISIALYEQRGPDGRPEYLVHSYSQRDGASRRIDFVVAAMEALAGLARSPAGPRRLRFACGGAHRLACKRAFLEACKIEPGTEPAARPLSIRDKRSGRTVTVEGTGDGGYRLAADGEDDGRERRLAAIAAGLVKLAEMRTVNETPDRVAFDCGYRHDALVGLLLARAINVRAVIREQELTASRGVLVAPSAQSD